MGEKVYYERDGVQLLAPIYPAFEEILTPDALAVVGELTRTLRPAWRELLVARRALQDRIDSGERPHFDPAATNLRNNHWKVAPIPKYLRRRIVENVCPASSEKMLLYGLNAKTDGADVALACLEDANGLQWNEGGNVHGLMNLYRASRGTLQYEHPRKGTQVMEEDHGVLMMRPRGLHFVEPRMIVDRADARPGR